MPLLSILLSADLPPSSVFDLNKEQLIYGGIYLLNIVVLTVVLAFILYKPVKAFMANRSKRIADEIETAKQELQKANALKEKYTDMIRDIEKEREEVLSAAHKKANEKSDSLLRSAKDEADALLRKVLVQIEAERESYVEDMKKEMIDVSFALATRFVTMSIDEATQVRLLDETIAAWEERATWQK